jgi:hypothetical protein
MDMPTKPFRLTLRPYHEICEWDRFVELHPEGTVFHTTAMIRCQAAAKLQTVFAYGALDSGGRLVAILVANRVSTLGGWTAKVASRSIMHSQPIFIDSPAGRQGVYELIRYHDAQMQNDVIFSEIRPVISAETPQDLLLFCGYQKLGYRNYELNISEGESELFKKMSGKCRNNVRSARRKGISVQLCDPLVDLPTYVGLISYSYGLARVPMVDASLFVAAASELPAASYRVLIAKYLGCPMATACFLAFKNRVICWYAGTRRVPGIAAGSALMWEAIRMYSNEGYEVLDFAGAGWEGEEYGPGRFKAKFGGQLITIGRYRKVYSPWKLLAAQQVYRSVRGWIAPNRTSLLPTTPK